MFSNIHCGGKHVFLQIRQSYVPYFKCANYIYPYFAKFAQYDIMTLEYWRSTGDVKPRD